MAETLRGETGVLAGYVLQWYIGALFTVTTSKIILGRLPDAARMLSFSQLAVCLVCCRIWVAAGRDSVGVLAGSRQHRKFLLGIGFTTWLGFVFTNSAFSLMSPSIVETIKMTEAIPTVALAALCSSEGWPSAVEVLAIAAIMLGAMLASYSDGTFSLSGGALVVGANVSFAITHWLMKVSYTCADSLDPANLFYRTSQIGLFFALPSVLLDARSMLVSDEGVDETTVSLMLCNGVGFFMYNRAMVLIVKHARLVVLTALDCFRRGLVALFTAWYFSMGVTPLNIVGITLAIGGVITFETHREQRKNTTKDEVCHPTASPPIFDSTTRFQEKVPREGRALEGDKAPIEGSALGDDKARYADAAAAQVAFHGG